MARDYLNDDKTRVRREDRAVTEDTWIRQFLHAADIGTLATVHDGQPFVNQNLYVYDETRHAIYIHTARKGRTRANIEEREQVCFSVMEMGRMLPAPEALEFSVEYAGVVVFGTSEIIEDEAEATDALQQLLDKYAPHLQPERDYRPPVPEELKRTSVFRVNIEAWTAKKKEVEAHDGAFWYPQAPILTSLRQRTVWQGELAGIAIASDGDSEITLVEQAELDKKSIIGDRYRDGTGTWSDWHDDSGKALTLIAQEDLDAIAHETGITITHGDTRRNLLTVGVPLNHLIGKRFAIGEVILEGVRLCEPCKILGERTAGGQKLVSAMAHRGGLRCEIMQGGVIRAGDKVHPTN
ncbi:MAG: pyridoxamine 5'-phosphate oxidase family protein [Chloroflexota bacterium]